MLEALIDSKSICKMASEIPHKLVRNYKQQVHYSAEQVRVVFFEVFDNDENIEYAYAMFCVKQVFDEALGQEPSVSYYSTLRKEISEMCFEGWPRFNFESFLNYRRQNSISDLVREVTDLNF